MATDDDVFYCICGRRVTHNVADDGRLTCSCGHSTTVGEYRRHEDSIREAELAPCADWQLARADEPLSMTDDTPMSDRARALPDGYRCPPYGLSKARWDALLERSAHDNTIRACFSLYVGGMPFAEALATAAIALSDSNGELMKRVVELSEGQSFAVVRPWAQVVSGAKIWPSKTGR